MLEPATVRRDSKVFAFGIQGGPRQLIASLLIACLVSKIASQSQCSLPSQTCGDGVITGSEQCDDGNSLNSDGCNATCGNECGFSCTSTWAPNCPADEDDSNYWGFKNSSCVPLFGDGKRVLGEECDDGNLNAGDGCLCALRNRTHEGGCRVESERWVCETVAELAITCQSRTQLADRCICGTEESQVELPAQPLRGIGQRTVATVSGFGGAGGGINCGSCACEHYGGCGAGAHCTWDGTCSGNGFCGGDGRCVCFGNFTGRNCNRCKKDHFGADCATYCRFDVTCGKHGYCDFDGNCARNPLCEGVDYTGNRCGDGRRLAEEECDDGNTRGGDGCSAGCQVEAGFVCTGGCQQGGDPRRRYGECGRDTCQPVPCGWIEMRAGQGEGGGALGVRQPEFEVKTMVHNNPTLAAQNSLTLTLAPNVPLQPCVNRTERSVVNEEAWRQVERERTWCDPSVITISGLQGASTPLNVQPNSAGELLLLLADGELPGTEPTDWYGWGGEAGVGLWDNFGKTLMFQVLRTQSEGEEAVIRFEVQNAESEQASPDIRVGMGSGLLMLDQPVDKQLAAFQFDNVGSLPLAIQPFGRRRLLSAPAGAEAGAGRDAARAGRRGGQGGRRLLEAQQRCPGGGGQERVCVAELAEALPYAAADNLVTVTLQPSLPVPAASDIYLHHLLPRRDRILFAVTSSTQCAQDLPYGPDDSQLYRSVLGEPAQAYLSTANRQVLHSAWVQELYDGLELQMTIFWSFLAEPKTLKQRFTSSADTAAEQVVWTVLDSDGVHRGTKRGTYRFSSKLAGVAEFGVEGVFESEGAQFSQDDGVWGAGTGVVDGAIDEVYGGILDDFWGHGNFNQQEDGTCREDACCTVYFKGGLNTARRSSLITSRMHLLNCTACQCIGDAPCTRDARVNDAHPHLLDTCGTRCRDRSYNCSDDERWFETFDGAVGLTVGEPGLSAGEVMAASFRITNPQERRQQVPPQVRLRIPGRAQPLDAELNTTGPGGWEGLELAASRFLVRAVGQSSAVPGAVNTLSVTLLPSAPLAAGSVVTISNLVPPPMLFAVTSQLGCSADLLPFGPEGPQNQQGMPYLSIGVGGNWEHSYWRQEVYSDGVHRFTSIWRFLAPKTLRQRLEDASTIGEPVLWFITPRGDQAEQFNATTKNGVWRPSIPDLDAGVGAWAATAIWGGASGTVDDEVLQDDFWGHADTREPSTNCQQMYMEGRASRPVFSIRSELYLEDTPLLTPAGHTLSSRPPASFRVGDFTSTGVGPEGVQGRLELELVGGGLLGGEEAVVNLTAMNRLDAGPSASAQVEVDGCNPVAAAALVGAAGVEAPLLISPPAFVLLRMGQNNPFPAALNVISVTMTLNFDATVFGEHRLELQNLAGARQASGPVPLRDPAGRGAHLYFAAAPEGTPGEGLWAEESGVLTLYLVWGPDGGSLRVDVEYRLELDLENPPYGQDAPDVVVTAHVGRTVHAVADKDTGTDLSLPPPLGNDVRGAVPGDAAALRVIPAVWAEGTRISQTSPYPGARNDIRVAINTNVALRAVSRSYQALVIRIAELSGAAIVTNPESVPLLESPRPTSVPDGASYFADHMGTGGRGTWVQNVTTMELRLADDIAPLSIYTFAFTVTNPVRGQSSPDVQISTLGVPVYTVDDSLCGVVSGSDVRSCSMPKIHVPLEEPLSVLTPRFLNKNMGQSIPYPATTNTLTITLGLNVPLPAEVDTLPDGVSVVISNLAGAVAGPAGVGKSPIAVYGRRLTGSGVLDGSSSEEYFGASYQGSPAGGEWDNDRKEVRLWVVRELFQSTLYVLSFELINPVSGQLSPDVAVAGLGIPIESVPVDKETLPLQLQGSEPGDAAPLRVYSAEFLVKRIGQTNPYPGALNSIRITLSMSVDLPASSHPDLYTSWRFRISGLFGGPAVETEYDLSDHELGDDHLSFASSDDTTCTDCIGKVLWDGRVFRHDLELDDNKVAVLSVRKGMVRQREYTLSFSFRNPATPQQSPLVLIRAEGLGTLETKVEMDRDTSTVLTEICPYPQCHGGPGDAMPLRVIEPRFLVKAIEQSNPFPGADNTITVTISLNVPLFPSSRNCSGIAFFTAARALLPLEPGIGSSLCLGGQLEGATCAEDAECDDLTGDGLFSCVEGVCDVDQLSATTVVLLGLTGPLTPNGPLDIVDQTGNSGGAFFAATAGGAAGQGLWEQDVGVLSLVVAQTMDPVVNYSFSFTTINPIAAQDSPPVSIALAGALASAPVPMNRSVGDGAPVKVLTVRFVFTRISQTNPYPFAVNTINVTLATNLPLTPSTRLTLYPFKDATMDADVPGYSAADNSVQLTDFSDQGGADFFGGQGVWQGANKAVVLSLATTAPQEQNMSVSFSIRNPGSAQASTRIWVAFSLEGSSFQATELDRDFSTDLSPSIPEATPGDAAPVRVLGPLWRRQRIGQRTPHPNARNTLTVTLLPAYAIPARARATITISSLVGASAPAGRIALQNASGGLCDDAGGSAGPECTRFAAELTSNGGALDVGFGQWDDVRKSIALALPDGLPAHTPSLLSFEILNPPYAQAAPIVLLELGGAAPIARGPMQHDLSTNLGNASDAGVADCERGRWVFLGGPGDAAAMTVFQAGFLCFGGGCGGGEGSVCPDGGICGGRIGQASAFPGAVNTITVTFATNVPLTADPPTQVVVRGLLNAINVEGGDSLAVVSEYVGPANADVDCVPSAPALRFAATDGGMEGRAQWAETEVDGGRSATVTLHLLQDSLPNALYKLSFAVRNPIPPQGSPDTFIEVVGTTISRATLVSAPHPFAPMLVVIPAFIVRTIRQETAIPSAENTLNVGLASNTPLYTGACLTLTGFANAQLIAGEGVPLGGGLFELPLRGPNSTLFKANDAGDPGFGLWDASSNPPSLRLTLVKNVMELEISNFTFRITNPALQQSAQPVRVEVACGVIIEPALFEIGNIAQYHPLRVLPMTILVRKIGQNNNYPGAVNFLTVTLAMNLDLSTALNVRLTISGLVNTLTESSPRLALHCEHTECCGRRQLSTACMEQGCCRDMEGTAGELCKIGDLRAVCGGEGGGGGGGGGGNSNGSGVCAAVLFGEVVDGGPDPTVGSSSGEWNQGAGTLTVAAVELLLGNQEYAFSFTVRNPLLPQAAPAVEIEASSGGSAFIAPISMTPDPAAPPLEVMPPSVLVAKAAQSSPFPCSSNTISITLALNIPLRPDVLSSLPDGGGGPISPADAGITIDGFRGATCPACRAGIECAPTCEVPLLPSPSSLRGRNAFTASFDSRTAALTLQVRSAADLEVGRTDFAPAGEPIEVRFELINNKEGQATSELTVLSVGVDDWLHDTTPFALPALASMQIGNCTDLSEEDAQPMLVKRPVFLTTKIAQSTPFPLHHNLITVTLSTNVPLRVRCLPVITISGFQGASGALLDLRNPGPEGTQWRSDACPNQQREAMRVSATLDGESVDYTFGYTGPLEGVRWGQGRAAGAGTAGCGGQGGGLTDCENKQQMCFGLDGGAVGLEGAVERWRAEEGVMTWFRGQQERSEFYSRPAEVQGLGDGECDAAWNCAEYAFDEGDCESGFGGPPEHGGTVAWRQESEQVVAHVLNDTEHESEYVLSFQLTNAATLHRGAEMSVEISGIAIAPVPLELPEALGSICNTGGVGDGEDRNPVNVYSASMLTYDIGQSTRLPGVQNTITVSLRTNVHIYPRTQQFLTILGLKGASAVSGPLQLWSSSTTHSFFQPTIGGQRGFGQWDNTAKQLALLVASHLLPDVAYTFWFTLTNPPTGQDPPTILVGAEQPACPPSARPLSTRIPVRLKTSEGLAADGAFPDLPGGTPTFTVRSFEDGTELVNCAPTLVDVQGTNVTELWVPAGPWFVSMSLTGADRNDISYFPDTIEVDSSLVRHADGSVEMAFVQGSSCGSIEERTFFQQCTWQPRIAGAMDVVLHPRQVGVTRLVLTWGDAPRDLDLYVTFTSGNFEPYLPEVSCPAGTVIRGGGVWHGCRDWVWWPPGVDIPSARQQYAQTGDFERLPRVTLERREDQGGRRGGEIVTLRNVDDAVVQIYVNSPSGEGFAGLEQLRVLHPLREGQDPRSPSQPSEQRVWTSVLSSVAGTWWHVGVLTMGSNLANFQVLNYDKLFADPLPYVFGYKLYLRLTCRSGRDGSVLRGVTYQLTYDTDQSTLLQGIVPDATLSFASPNYNVTGTISAMDFTVSLTLEGFAPRTVAVRYAGEDTATVDVFLVPQDSIIRIFASWRAPIRSADLWVFPCTDSGQWTVQNAATSCPGGPVLDAGAVHQGCSEYAGSSGQTVTHSVGFGGLHIVELVAGQEFTAAGTFDIFVHVPADAAATEVAGELRLEVIAMSGLEYVVEELALTQVAVEASGGGSWWHPGYMLLDGTSLPQLVDLNFFGSSPTGSGCRIPSRSVPMVTRAFDPTLTTVVDLRSGISVLIPPNEWPPDVPAVVTVMQLQLRPAMEPEGARFSGATIYLEPSGVTFLGVGATIEIPLFITSGDGEQQLVHRLENGVWVPVRPSVVVTGALQATTPRFSAYTPMIVQVPPPPPPPPVVNNRTDDDEVVSEEGGDSNVLLAALAGALGGLLAIFVVAAIVWYRRRHGRFPWQKPPIPETPKENKPVKSTEITEMRLKMYKQEVSSRQKYSTADEPNELALDIRREVAVSAEPSEAALVPADTAAQRYQVAASLHGPTAPRIANGHQPPDAIAHLVRTGVLVPNRGAAGTGVQVEGEIAPTKVVLGGQRVAMKTSLKHSRPNAVAAAADGDVQDELEPEWASPDAGSMGPTTLTMSGKTQSMRDNGHEEEPPGNGQAGEEAGWGADTGLPFLMSMHKSMESLLTGGQSSASDAGNGAGGQASMGSNVRRKVRAAGPNSSSS